MSADTGLLVIVGVFAFLAVLLAAVLLFSRRSHLRAWRFGVFYESKERFTDDDGAELEE